jgi:aminoglycoside phosphotransferase (APT) family kinase protein
MSPDSPSWTRDQAELTVHEALAASDGLGGRAVQLIRFGSNALYHVNETELLLRVSPPCNSLKDVERTILVADGLTSGGILVPRPEPLWNSSSVLELASGAIVSSWGWLHDTGEQPRPGDLGRLLVQIHSLSLPISLPTWDPMANVYYRLEQAGDKRIPSWIRRRIAEEARSAERALGSVKYELQPGVIHGDAHIGNLLSTPNGPAVLDLDDFCHGPREFDLAPTLAATRRLDLDEHDWASFCAAYGYDLATTSAAETLVRLRQLTMTTWLSDQWGSDPRIDAEIELRVRSMDEERGPWTKWTAF